MYAIPYRSWNPPHRCRCGQPCRYIMQLRTILERQVWCHTYIYILACTMTCVYIAYLGPHVLDSFTGASSTQVPSSSVECQTEQGEVDAEWQVRENVAQFANFEGIAKEWAARQPSVAAMILLLMLYESACMSMQATCWSWNIVFLYNHVR